MHVIETEGENVQKPAIQSGKTIGSDDPEDLAIELVDCVRERIRRETAAEEPDKKRRKEEMGRSVHLVEESV